MSDTTDDLIQPDRSPLSDADPAPGILPEPDGVRSSVPPSGASAITRQAIGVDMLERYTGCPVGQIRDYVLLTNFQYYIERFPSHFPPGETEARRGSGFTLINAPNADITILDYKIGSPTAALAMDLLSFRRPRAVLMLGLCGGLSRKLKVGDFVLPMAAIRDEGSSRHYMPERVPALPTFNIQKACAETLVANDLAYRSGVIHTTDYRFWEFDEVFRNRLVEERAMAIDMECATLFVTGFAKKIPIGALMLVSDMPLNKDGIKTRSSANSVFSTYTEAHLRLGLDALRSLRQHRDDLDMRHYEW